MSLEELMQVDSLAVAEKITGKSYKDDEGTMSLGFLLNLENAQAKRRAAEATGDTHYSTDLATTLSIYADLGFTEVLCDEFTGRHREAETYRILWHEDGLLATVESYKSTGRNNAKMYYNIRFPFSDSWPSATSSGSFTADNVWVGDHDMREGMRFKLANLRAEGEFLPVWRKRPFLWLLTYMDTEPKDCDHEAITEERISRLPKHVQAAIAGSAA